MPGLITNAAYTKRFTDANYTYTTSVLHQGTMIAFAMDAGGHIYYSVLNFNDASLAAPQHDTAYWSTVDPARARPIPLAFPSEIRKAGHGSFGQSSIAQTPDGVGGLDTFRSTTAQYTDPQVANGAPFCAFSDGTSVFVFRRSRQPTGPSASVADSDPSHRWSFGDHALLVDRYSLSGGSLLQKSEARYQRSRSKDFPATSKDCLAAQDMNGTPFYEPTLELAFVQNFNAFAVTLIPTAVAGASYWHIFAHNITSMKIDTYGVRQSQDGLFDFAGPLSFACTNPSHADLQSMPGSCGRPCGKALALTPGSDPAQYTCLNGHSSPAPGNGSCARPCGITFAEVSLANTSFQAAGFRHNPFGVTYIGSPIEINYLTARLYYQQESMPSGYPGPGNSKPHKAAPHVMLAFDGETAIGVLDFATDDSGCPIVTRSTFEMIPILGQGSITLRKLSSNSHNLSVCCGLLVDVARAGRAPVLLDSSTGDLRLYWATTATAANLVGLTYNTTVVRPQVQWVLPGQTLTLLATVAGTDLNGASLSIAPDGFFTCTVTITHGAYCETWRRMPLDAQSIVAVLNGAPQPPDPWTGIVAVYDNTNATSTWPGADLSGGSLWMSAVLSGPTFTVTTTGPLVLAGGSDAGFRAAPSTSAIPIDALLQLATPPAPGDPVPATPSWDLTLETWVKPASPGGQVLIAQQATSTSAYVLALLPASGEQIALAASILKSTSGGTSIRVQSQTKTTIPLNEWSHVAAAFHQKAAVQLDGVSAFADCGDDGGLNLTGDLTIEIWFSTSQPSGTALLSKGILGDGITPDPITGAATASLVPYALYLNDSGRLTFIYSRASGELCFAEAPQTLTGPCAIAVTRQCGRGYFDKDALKQLTWDEITFYVTDGAGLATTAAVRIYTTDYRDSDTSTIAGNGASLVLGRCVPVFTHAAMTAAVTSWQASPNTAIAATWTPTPGSFGGILTAPATPVAATAFHGIFSEVRLWGTALPASAIGANLDDPQAATGGLVSRWRFEERSGQQSQDSGHSGGRPARLMNLCTWVQSPHKALSWWTLYLNSVAQQTAPVNLDRSIPAGTLSLGDLQGSPGQLAEVRIWSTERPRHAIADNLFRTLPRDPGSGRVLGNENGDDLLAYYTLDSALISTWGTLPQVFDRSQGGTGNVLPAPAGALNLRQGGAYYWNGQTTATVAGSIPLTGSFTIEFWCRRGATGHDDFILQQNAQVGQAEGRGSSLAIGFRGANNKVEFCFFGDDVSVAHGACNDDRWHHWAFVYDSSTRTRAIYLDGGILLNQTVGGVAGSGGDGVYSGGNGPITLGYMLYSVNCLQAFVQELRIWSSALTRPTIVANWNRALGGTEAGLLALWPMTNILGTTLPDRCGHFNATLAPSGALYFDGQTSATIMGGNLQNTSNFTIEFWCKRSSTTTPQHVLVQNIANPATDASLYIGFVADTAPGNNKIQFSFFGDDVNVASPACTDGLWHHWAFVYDAVAKKRFIYLDGGQVQGSPFTGGQGPGSTGAYLGGGGPITLAPLLTNTNTRLTGHLQELRIWVVNRSASNITTNKGKSLKGNEPWLLALWPLTTTAGTYVQDRCPGNHYAALSSPVPTPPPPPANALNPPVSAPSIALPTPLPSTAPVGPDIPEITNAAGGVPTDFAAHASMPLGVEEYGVIQIDAAGNASAVLKRGFSLIQKDVDDQGQWLLAGGYKVANLGTDWIGQVQFAPQVMGYIEGAPPVPGENMTDPDEDYRGASSVQFTCADQVNYSYDAQRDKGFDYAVDASAMAGFGNVTSLIVAPLGIGYINQVADVHYDIGVRTSFSGATSRQSGANAGFSLSQNQLSATELQGYHFDAGDDLGARWVPLNVGYALVKSSTADLYALRLLSNGALVGYQMVPNRNIPPDWNIITFPINPFYIRQGCLDGRFGALDGSIKIDPHFPAAAPGVDASYHRVAEAYALKSRIDREEYQLYTDYTGNDAVSQGSASWVDTNRINSSMANHVPGAGNRPTLALGAAPSTAGSSSGSAARAQSDSTQLVKRNLCNTYVWTAYGGLFSETEQSLDGFTETYGGGYQFMGMGGLAVGLNASVGPADLTFSLEAMFGSHVNVTMTKAASASTGFGVDVALNLPRDLSYNDTTLVNDPYSYLPNIQMAKPAPGRVDAYRFMTFYLAPTASNYTEFFNRVVNPKWLESADPNAAALRNAKQDTKSPPCWRVLHRVTFVSRVADARAAPVMQSPIIKLDAASHYLLIKRLEPYVLGNFTDWPSLRTAVTSALSTCYAVDFPALLQAGTVLQVAQLMASYYGVTVTNS